MTYKWQTTDDDIIELNSMKELIKEYKVGLTYCHKIYKDLNKGKKKKVHFTKEFISGITYFFYKNDGFTKCVIRDDLNELTRHMIFSDKQWIMDVEYCFEYDENDALVL